MPELFVEDSPFLMHWLIVNALLECHDLALSC